MKRILFVTLMMVVLISGCFEGATEQPGELEPPNEKIDEVPQQDEFVEITVSSVGDIMVHSLQIDAAYDEDTNKYDFKNNFTYVKPYIEDADLALANLETTFAGAERGYSGFPLFNTPDTLADAIYNAGFRVISTINNHTIDTGITGMLRTLDILKDRELIPVGTKSQPDEKSYSVEDINGVKVGITAYSYESPSDDGRKRLNGILLPQEYEDYLDTFDYDNIELDLLKMEQRITDMREDGADAIIFIIHWGNEYHRSYNSHQQNIAENLNKMGVDIIFGSHPHVIQPMEIIEGDNGHETFVAYSLGNFISNQRYEFLQNRYTEDGVVAYVTLKKNMTTGEVHITDTAYLPTWVNRHVVSGQWVYEVIPVYQALENKEKYNLLTEDSIKRAQISLDNTVSWIEQHNPKIRQIKIGA